MHFLVFQIFKNNFLRTLVTIFERSLNYGGRNWNAGCCLPEGFAFLVLPVEEDDLTGCEDEDSPALYSQ